MHSIHSARKIANGWFQGVLRLGAVVLVSVVAAGFGASACLNRPLCDTDCRPTTTNIFVDAIEQKSVDKIDLLFMIDNSISMADKQNVLQAAVPDLVQRLVSPNCVDATTGVPAATTPTDPAAACPAHLVREFTPIRNIHVGIVTSSIGGHGSTTLCVGNDSSGSIVDQEQDDHGWLVGKRPRYATPAGGVAPDPEGFLNWDPDTNKTETVNGFTTTFQAMTTAVGEQGCGLESQLEGWYRFLIDPSPHQSIAITNCPGTQEPCASPQGKDTNLLAQRAAFLRPDSLVAIVMLTDENDCSIRESGQYYYAARDNIILPHGSAACITNPNDKCCYFCGSAAPSGCAADPSCATPTPRDEDPPNLRCWHEKQRFGFDFLYPTARYVNALTQPQICTSRADLAPDATSCPDLDGDKQPDIVDNPLFVGVNGSTAIPRDGSLVFLAGIIGVPWQDIQATEKPDGSGTYDPNELHYKTAAQLMTDKAWDTIVGDDNPGNNLPPILPIDNLMVESKDPRGGDDAENPPQPLIGTNGGYLANKVNGHEWVNSDQDDLQYACIFPLAKSRDCAALVTQDPAPGCDCKPGKETDDNPLCQSPNGRYSTTQSFAKGYPGLRELQVLKDFGNNSIVASLCARNLTDDARQDYGYRPAVDAIVDRLKEAFTAKCLPRTLSPDKTGKIPCSVVEVRPRPASGANVGCTATPGRSDPEASVVDSVLGRLRSTSFCDAGPNTPACSAYSLCEINEAGSSCHQNQTPTETGWCYVDPATQPGDDPSLVAKCPATERQIIRFVDPMNQTPANDSTVFIACFGATLTDEAVGL